MASERKGKEKARPARPYDLEADMAEENNVIAEHPRIVKFLLALADQACKGLGDCNRKGQGTRPTDLVKTSKLLVKAP